MRRTLLNRSLNIWNNIDSDYEWERILTLLLIEDYLQIMCAL